MSMLTMMPASPKEAEIDGAFLVGNHVDGVILVSLHDDDPLPGRLAQHQVPFVIQGGLPEGLRVSSVDVDNRGAGELATEHLIGLGRRRIATIAGNLSMPGAVERLDGYRDALTKAGLPLDASLEGVGDYTAEQAHLAMSNLLKAHPDLDAVFAASDLMARAAMGIVTRSGRRIPDDVAVIGFDDSVIARAARPPMSSIKQPIEGLGRESVKLLAELMAGPATEPKRVILPTELVIRESTAGRS